MFAEHIEQLALVVGLAFASMGAGVIAAFRPPGDKLRSVVLHFAAGVVFSVVAVELIPDLLKLHAPILTAVGFAFGVATMLGVRALLEMKKAAAGDVLPISRGNPEGQIPLAMLLATAIDLAVDGLLLGIGFAAGMKEGRMLAFALAIELIALALATVATLQKSGTTRNGALKLLAYLLVVFVASAAVGTLLLGQLRGHALSLVLSFGCAALLFLVTEELLVEAHEQKEAAWLTATFFVGFLLLLVIGVVG